MPEPVLVLLAAMAAVAVLIAGLATVERRRLATRDAGLARDAAMRGWRYRCRTSRGRRTEVWEGAGLGGAWSAEIVHDRRRKGPKVRVLRWRNAPAEAPDPPSADAVLFVSLGDGVRLPAGAALAGAALAGGLLDRLADGAARVGLAVALALREGRPSVFRGELIRVDPDHELVPGFAVLVTSHAARALVTPALCAAVAQAFAPGAWTATKATQPWVTLVGDRVSVTCTAGPEPDAADVAALVAAGSVVASSRDPH